MTVDFHRHRGAHSVWGRYLPAVVGLALVLWLATRVIDTRLLGQTLRSANPWWLAAALVFKLLTPFGTASLYASVLRLLGHHARAARLWLTAQIAIVINMAFPAGPVAMSAFLLHVFRCRRVPEGVTTLQPLMEYNRCLKLNLGSCPIR